MSHPFSNQKQIGIVTTFSELVQTDFKGENNALCWYRNLEGNFKELVSQLQLKENITEVTPEDLLALDLCEKGTIANTFALNDLRLFPNPVKNIVSISNNSTINTVAITSVLGQEILRKSVNDLQTEIDLSSFAKGVYFVKVSSKRARKNN